MTFFKSDELQVRHSESELSLASGGKDRESSDGLIQFTTKKFISWFQILKNRPTVQMFLLAQLLEFSTKMLHKTSKTTQGKLTSEGTEESLVDCL